MPRIKLDDVEYNTEDLTEEGLAQFKSLQFLEAQMVQLNNEIVVYKTAQFSFIASLKAEIEKSGIQPISESTTDEE